MSDLAKTIEDRIEALEIARGDHDRRLGALERGYFRAVVTVSVASPTVLEGIRLIVEAVRTAVGT